MIKKIGFVFLILLMTGCKTFIVKGDNVDWSDSEYDDFNVMTDDMCISNSAKANDSPACYSKSLTRKVTKNGNTYIFSINKQFIENSFKSSELEKELEGKFKVKSNDNQVNALIGIASFFSNTVKYGIKDLERKQKEKYIKKSIQYLFYTAHSRFENNYNDESIGIGIRPIRYTSYLESETGDYGLAEVFFVDMNDSTVIGDIIYGYIDFFKSGHGGFNILIPTCYTQTSKRIDGCELNSKKDIKKMVRKSQKSKTGYGEPVFEISLASYITPPSEPKAKGIPLNFG